MTPPLRIDPVTLQPVQPSDVNAGRLPAPQINPFREFVSRELVRRRTTYPTPTTAPFVRFTSCMRDPTSRYCFFSLGLHGWTQDSENMFDSIYSPDREIVGSAIIDGQRRLIDTSMMSRREGGMPPHIDDLVRAQEAGQQMSNTSAGGYHPIPGITSIRVSRFSMGAGMKASVSWQCYNRQQLEFIRHHFMMPGNWVILEWGHQSSDKQLNNVLDFTASDIKDKIADISVLGRAHVNNVYSSPNDGNYDVMVAKLSNFTINLDTKTNIYTCTTDLISSGEYLFGLNTNMTFIGLGSGSATPPTTATDFKTYFESGQGFDQFLGRTNAHIARPISTGQSNNAMTWVFISWNCFINEMLKDVLATLRAPNNPLSVDINALIRFSQAESRIASIAMEGAGTIPEAILATAPWVGNNPNLRSTDIETMIIIKKNNQPDLARPQFINLRPFFNRAVGTFDDLRSDRGLLSRGVWLNTEKIRSSFLLSDTLEQAIRTILFGMNNATAGYWNLMIYFDQDTMEFSIIDNKFSNLLHGNEFYKFNTGMLGECLEINLDAVYPKEVIMQLACSARIQADALLSDIVSRKYDLYNQTSHYAIAMNWTSLTDCMEPVINTRRAELVGRRNAAALIQGGRASSENSQTTTNVSQGAPSIRVSPTNPAPGVPVGSVTAVLNTARIQAGTPTGISSDPTIIPAPLPEFIGLENDARLAHGAIVEAGEWLTNFLRRNNFDLFNWKYKERTGLSIDMPTLIQSVMFVKSTWGSESERRSELFQADSYLTPAFCTQLWHVFGPDAFGQDEYPNLLRCDTPTQEGDYALITTAPFGNLARYVAVRLAQVFRAFKSRYGNNIEGYLTRFIYRTQEPPSTPRTQIHIAENILVTPEAAAFIGELIRAGLAVGVEMRITFSFRSYATQQQLYLNHENNNGPHAASPDVPGAYHLTGTAIDVYPMAFDFKTGNCPEADWQALEQVLRAQGWAHGLGSNVNDAWYIANDRGHWVKTAAVQGPRITTTTSTRTDLMTKQQFLATIGTTTSSQFSQNVMLALYQFALVESQTTLPVDPRQITLLRSMALEMQRANPASDFAPAGTEIGMGADGIPFDVDAGSVIDSKFGEGMSLLIEMNQIDMSRRIINHGLAPGNIDSLVNGFVAPFPTQASIDIVIRGITGISIFDAFMVGKLPYMYESFGIFHVLELTDDVSSQGWVTKIRGMFRFMRLMPLPQLGYGEVTPDVPRN